MGSLLRQLLTQPARFAHLLGATFFIHLLGLAGTLYVILVFNNYLPYGVSATLVTLAAGALIAGVCETAFRRVRHRLSESAFSASLSRIAQELFTALTRARRLSLESIAQARRQEALHALATLEQLASPPTVGALLDAPFALVALIALFLISPWLALIALLAIGLAWGATVASRSRLQRLTQDCAQQESASRALATMAIEQPDTVRAFNAQAGLAQRWQAVRAAGQLTRSASASAMAVTQSLTASIAAWQGVAIIGVGAVSAANGELSAGALIGANILAARALAPLLRLASMGDLFARAALAERQITEILRLPREADSGVEPTTHGGGIELSDVAFFYPGMTTPLFEHLSLRLTPGSALGVVGGNGSGKTTLACLLCGLIDPVRGQILVDGMDLRQINPAWWRRQIGYLPQEPAFLDATVRENFPGGDRLGEALQLSGLRGWLDGTPRGLETPLPGGGRSLAAGVRKRMALARALMAEGRLAIFDEPTDALDDEGRAAVYQAMNMLRSRGITLIVLTHDPNVLRGVDWILDLRIKPTPHLYPAGSFFTTDPESNVKAV
jgi:ATP-binding cassette subfamily C protein LapB